MLDHVLYCSCLISGTSTQLDGSTIARQWGQEASICSHQLLHSLHVKILQLGIMIHGATGLQIMQDRHSIISSSARLAVLASPSAYSFSVWEMDSWLRISPLISTHFSSREKCCRGCIVGINMDYIIIWSCCQIYLFWWDRAKQFKVTKN